MKEIIRFGVGLLLVPTLLVFFRHGDPVLLYFIVGAFFSQSKKCMVASLFVFGIILDSFTPFFGYHLITYACVYAATTYLAQSLLTTKSLASFMIIVLFSTLLSTVLSQIVMLAYSFFSEFGEFYFTILFTARQFMLALVTNILLALAYYALSRSMSSEFSLK